MTADAEPSPDRPATDPVGAETPPQAADIRMAEILAGNPSVLQVRQELRDQGDAESEDLLGRLNALEFVGAIVGDEVDLPERLGDYRITGLLGRGGMGTVYAAYQESLEREVALKVLSPTLSADPTMRQRFRSEARAIAMLHHPHIVPIFDYGEAGGLMYFAMEKIDGVSLDRHIHSARQQNTRLMDPREAARRFAGVADALGHAHKRRLLHRDVKPGNLLVARDGTLSLVDFGLSKALGEVSMSLTTGGAFLGTLLYAPPEQALGRPLSEASDLYSLGVTLFEAVTGELPLKGKTTEAMLEALLNGTPQRLRDVDPKVPRDLDAVVEKLLAKEPGDRYHEAEVLARDLLRVADGEPVRIRRQPILVRAMRRARKNPGLTTALALSAVSLITSAVLWQSGRVEHGRLQESRHQLLLQEAISEAMSEQGAVAGPGGLFPVLVGLPAPEVPTKARVLDLLAAAEAYREDDNGRCAAIRAAYLSGAAAELVPLLNDGLALSARRLLDARIDAAQSGFVTRDDPTFLQLYTDYVTRAVAHLMAAVAQPDAARVDLIRASMLRPGAFFPQLLLSFLEWQPTQGPELLLTRLRALVAEGMAGARETTGMLLLHFAGVHRAKGAHWVDLPMPYGHRRMLHEAALELLGNRSPAPPARVTGLESRLVEAGRSALKSLGDVASFSRSLEVALQLLREEIDPLSPLQAYGFAYRLLADAERARALLPDGRPMPEHLQVAAFFRFLELAPPRELVLRVRPLMDAILANQGDPFLVQPLRASLAAAVGTPEEVLEAATRWLQVDPESPEPLLMRFLGHARQGDLTRAQFAGIQVRQSTADWSSCRTRLLAILDDVCATATEEAVPKWRRLKDQFAQS